MLMDLCCHPHFEAHCNADTKQDSLCVADGLVCFNPLFWMLVVIRWQYQPGTACASLVERASCHVMVQVWLPGLCWYTSRCGPSGPHRLAWLPRCECTLRRRTRLCRWLLIVNAGMRVLWCTGVRVYTLPLRTNDDRR
jgi:hypothetical protein